MWTDACEASFSRFVAQLETPTGLAPVDPTKKLFLEVDGSGVGVGAVLYQKRGGQRDIIGLYSKAVQESAGASMLELRGVQLALRQFRALIGGTPLVVLTDHKPNTSPVLSKLVTKKTLRILEELSDYSLEWQYIEGRKHTMADWLSRDAVSCAPCPVVPLSDVRRH